MNINKSFAVLSVLLVFTVAAFGQKSAAQKTEAPRFEKKQARHAPLRHAEGTVDADLAPSLGYRKTHGVVHQEHADQ